ncbi:MAG: hypothetical protein ACRDDY_13810 [Clostridium sp.]|uniref:hypothetical protein n=1 Tax=Clostridium sp. TaxID=1506 RepID=UPI003EE4ED79
MSLYQYAAKLLPSMESKAVKLNLETAQEQITNNLLVGTDMFVSTLGHEYKWKNAELIEISNKIAKAVRTQDHLKLPRDCSGIEAIQAVLKNMQHCIPVIISEANRSFETKIFRSGLTFTKAVILQYAETVDFVVTYTATLLNWMTATEYNTLDGRDRKSGISPNVYESIVANSVNYIEALKIMAMTTEQLKRGIKTLPQMRIAETAEGEAEQIALGGGNANPFGFANLSWPLSMLYHYRLSRVEAQAQEFERLTAQEKALHYRVLLIKNRLERGEGDVALEKELSIHEERIRDLDYKLAQLTKKYKL